MEYSHSTGWTSGREITEFQENLATNLGDVVCGSPDWNSCTFSEEHDCGHGEDVFLSCSSGKDAEDASGEEPSSKSCFLRNNIKSEKQHLNPEKCNVSIFRYLWIFMDIYGSGGSLAFL